MPTPRFVLKAPKSLVATPVVLCYSWDTYRLKWSTGILVPPSQWNPKKQRATAGRTYPLNAEMNYRIDAIQTAVGVAFYRLQNNGNTVTPPSLLDELKRELGLATGRKKKEVPTGLAAYARYYMEQVAGTKKRGIMAIYLNAANHFTTFDKLNGRTDLADVTMDWYYSFVKYLTGKGLQVNSRAKVLRIVKLLLKKATQQGVKVCQDFRNSDFKAPTAESDNIALTEADLASLDKLDLPLNSPLAHVRDAFLISAYSALRHSDVRLIRASQISTTTHGRILTLRTKKTDQLLRIPVHPVVEDVLARNNGEFPRTYGNFITNKYLRQIARQAGLVEIVELTRFNDKGEKEIVSKPKYELVQSHTGRRTALTILYRKNIPLPTLMALSGHSTPQMLLRYIKVKGEEHADALLTHPFFKKAA